MVNVVQAVLTALGLGNKGEENPVIIRPIRLGDPVDFNAEQLEKEQYQAGSREAETHDDPSAPLIQAYMRGFNLKKDELAAAKKTSTPIE